MKSFANVV